MNFDFDQLIDRRETNSYKWYVTEKELPMWVADMDFATAPVIVEAIEKRLHQGALGYNTVPESFQESIVEWWQRRHRFTMKPEWILYCTGVVPAISSIVRKMTKAGENVAVLAPVYNIFYNSILNNGRNVLASEMVYRNGFYSIDYDDLEAKLALKETTLFLFCNPHNPIGKVWDKETLQRIGELCLRHDVLLLSDEIHCDLTHPGCRYTPMAAISKEIAQRTITCIAPTKTFNIAGLQTSAIVIPNEEIRRSVDRGINTDEVAEPNSFSIQAAEAASRHGEDWLRELTVYLDKNKAFLKEYIERHLPFLSIIPAEATYLAWIDCSALTADTTALCELIRRETGLYLSDGAIFGGNGKQFIRWNYARPEARLRDGLERFQTAIKRYLEKNRSCGSDFSLLHLGS